ncbi:MAG: Mut7-C RNAse domain-containing protein [Gammaproteobacteria bacterium]|nr:Mut7-C RNAse domain-containing protein [Gammaproteobacteria bacterium]
MKLFCDEMLIKLGRWLRVAGYDTRIARQGMDDRQIIQLAKEENRRLITRDRKLLEFRNAAATVVLLDCKLMDQCLEEVTQKLHINWLNNPFSRCLNCNTLLLEAGAEQYQLLPETIKKTVTGLCYCPDCQQLFWEGGHVQRMRHQLEYFSEYFGDSQFEQRKP